MALLGDLKILLHMALSSNRGETHAGRMEGFYRGQAEGYDDFRRRLLQGRAELFAALDVPENTIWADMGGGTGSSLEFMGDKLSRMRKTYIVDLAPSLLEMAGQRVAAHGWNHVEAVEADATRFAPEAGQLGLVTFSYSLTMIPDWFAAIDHALELLEPGGLIGVVDFYVSRKHPVEGFTRHGWATRSLWPIWFARDNVFPSSEHLPYLHARFEPLLCIERLARVPYLPGFRTPYYLFIGRKR